jgi:hypothetical protein
MEVAVSKRHRFGVSGRDDAKQIIAGHGLLSRADDKKAARIVLKSPDTPLLTQQYRRALTVDLSSCAPPLRSRRNCSRKMKRGGLR